MVEYQVGDTIFELLNNSSEKFSRAQAWILPTDYRYRVPGFLSGRPNWFPSPAWECCYPPLGPREWRRHTHVGGGGAGSNSDEGTNTLVLIVRVYYNLPHTHRDHGPEINTTA
jgi:hypothetical protein